MRILPIKKDPINLKNTDIYYIPVPKVACTSMKTAIYKYNNPALYKIRRWIDPIYDFNPHMLYGSLNFSRYKMDSVAGKFFCIVRDPVARFVSAYDDIVLRRKKLAAVSHMVPEKALPNNPDIDQFLNRFEDYMEFGPYVRHHFLPMVTYIGVDTSFYFKVFDLHDFENIMKFLLNNGVNLDFLHANRGSGERNKSKLTASQCSRIKNIYIDDYEFIKNCGF